MTRLKTLRFRFAMWTAGLLLIVLAAFGAFVYLSLRQGLATHVAFEATQLQHGCQAKLELFHGSKRCDRISINTTAHFCALSTRSTPEGS